MIRKRDLDCTACREGLSAGLDDEEPGLERARLDRHLAECTECRAWQAAVHDLTRRARLESAGPIPDLSGAILAAHDARTPPVEKRRPSSLGPSRLEGGGVFRAGLAAVAVVQFVVAIVGLVTASGSATAIHASRDLGSWDAALAVALAYAAWKPQRAAGMVPLLAAVSGFLALSAGIDVGQGYAAAVHEGSHVLTLFALGLLWAVSRRAAPQRRLVAVN